MTTVVIVEDEPLLRAGLRELLGVEEGLSVIGEAADGQEALAVIWATQPDVALVDIRLPIMDGIEVTRQVAAGQGAPRVLLLTTFASEEHMMDGLSAGASGFLVKTASPEQVIAAIHSVAAGQSVVAPVMIRSLINRAVGQDRGQEQDGAVGQDRGQEQDRAQEQDPDTMSTMAGPQTALEPRPGRALPPLSSRETDVLQLMAQGRSDKAIARSLGIALPTVKSHVHRVLTKLDVSSRVQAAIAAKDAGLGGPPTSP